jgi:hypothetical protein
MDYSAEAYHEASAMADYRGLKERRTREGGATPWARVGRRRRPAQGVAPPSLSTPATSQPRPARRQTRCISWVYPLPWGQRRGQRSGHRGGHRAADALAPFGSFPPRPRRRRSVRNEDRCDIARTTSRRRMSPINGNAGPRSLLHHGRRRCRPKSASQVSRGRRTSAR